MQCTVGIYLMFVINTREDDSFIITCLVAKITSVIQIAYWGLYHQPPSSQDIKLIILA